MRWVLVLGPIFKFSNLRSWVQPVRWVSGLASHQKFRVLGPLCRYAIVNNFLQVIKKDWHSVFHTEIYHLWMGKWMNGCLDGWMNARIYRLVLHVVIQNSWTNLCCFNYFKGQFDFPPVVFRKWYLLNRG